MVTCPRFVWNARVSSAYLLPSIVVATKFSIVNLTLSCKVHGFKLLFLPKFHCELNVIEQCWEYSKWIYCLNPESSCEDVLQKNMLAALESVSLKSMRKFANHSCRFINSYMHGLNGRQAA